MTDKSATRHLSDLSTEECWRLAATRPVGRLGWQSHDGVTIVPVNITVADEMVHLRTAAYSTIAREVAGRPVAVEVDELDEETHTGWSVLMRGRAALVRDLPPGSPEPEPWPSARRPLLVEIDVTEISGRRLGAG